MKNGTVKEFIIEDDWIADAITAREINQYFLTHYTADDIARMPVHRIKELQTVIDLLYKR